MWFRDVRPLLPGFAIIVAVGVYLWVDRAPEKPPLPAATTQSGTWGSPAPPNAKLATLRETVFPSPTDSTGLAKLMDIVQALQSSNKALSDQVSALAARLDTLEKARAEVREQPQVRTRRRSIN